MPNSTNGDPSPTSFEDLDWGIGQALLWTVAWPLFLIDREGTILGLNEAGVEYIERIWGEPPSPGDSMRAYATDESYANFRAALEQAFAGEVVSHVRLLEYPSGEKITYEISYTPIRDRSAEISAVLFSARDLDASSQSSLHTRFFERALDELSIGVTVADLSSPDMPLTYVNTAFTRLTGYAREQVLGRNCRFLQGDDTDQSELRVMREALANHEAVTTVLRNYRADGELFYNRVTLSPIFEGGEAPRYYIGLQEDVTRSVFSEQTLQRLQRMETATRLAAGVAHDLNNVLQIIQSYTRLARDTLDPSSVTMSDLEVVEHAVEQAIPLTRNLLLFARQKRLAYGDVELVEIVSRMRPVLGAMLGSKVKLEVILPDAPVWCHGSGDELEQVLLNLISNAADAIADRGHVQVTLRLDGARGSLALLEVKDDGEGIEPHILEHVFEPFFTTKPEGQGTGLGLATCYGIVRRHEGTIDIDSTPGEGTSVRVRVPTIQVEGSTG